jgi:hypothetical protein
VIFSTSTLSLGSSRLSSQISGSTGETTTKFCSGTGFACYMPAIPTSSALSTTSTNCSGTFYPFGVDYITETITEGEYITASGNSSTPQPIYITPLPFCSTFSGRNIFAGITQYSTRLVTKVSLRHLSGSAPLMLIVTENAHTCARTHRHCPFSFPFTAAYGDITLTNS